MRERIFETEEVSKPSVREAHGKVKESEDTHGTLRIFLNKEHPDFKKDLKYLEYLAGRFKANGKQSFSDQYTITVYGDEQEVRNKARDLIDNINRNVKSLVEFRNDKIIEESLENEDGWSDEIVDILEPPIEEVEELAYELRNTVRGAKTGVDDVDGLIDHCEHIMSRFDDAVDDLEDNSDDLNESDEWHDTADREQDDEPDYIPDEMDRYEAIAHKTVYDYDGFTTDYTLYFDHEDNNYFTVFGDNDLYGPEDSEHDWDFGPNEDEALEWFEDYEGFVDTEDVDLELTDDDLDESLNEAYVSGDSDILKIIRADKEYGKNYHVKGYIPDFSKIPNGTVITLKGLNPWHRDVYATLEKNGEDDWTYTWFTSDGPQWNARKNNHQAMREINEVDNGAFESLKKTTKKPVNESLLYRDNGAGLAEKGYLFTIQELGKIYDDSVKAKDPVVMEYKNFSDWMNDTVESGLLEIVDERAFDESCNEKLIQSSSDKAFKKNIATEIKAGKDPKQAAAIAYSIKRKNESVNDGWEEVSGRNGYKLFRKIVDGKGKWRAQKVVKGELVGEPFDITYEQALGREPIEDKPIAELSKKLGKILLPKSVKESDEIKRYSDVVPKENRRYWYFTTHGVQPGSLPDDVNILEVRDGVNDKGTEGTFVLLDAILNTSELKYYDMKELAPKTECLSESLDISDEDFQQRLKNELQGKLQYHYKKLGYTPREIEDYIMPVYKTEFRKGYGDDGSDALFVWVGAEVDYDELEELAQILNRVIRKYDKDAYFEPETSGRLISVLWD